MIRYFIPIISWAFFAVTSQAATMVDPDGAMNQPKDDHALIKGFHKVAMPGVRSVTFKPGESASFDSKWLKSLVKDRTQHQFEVRSYSCDGDPATQRTRIAADRAKTVRQFLVKSGVDDSRISTSDTQPGDKCKVTVTAFGMLAK